ncbi:hypothetical protein [Streptomyces atratus]|uniref:hypothetical protein n=1 Tax=Streptomyces atratus TaxID=1893 RepID=UPI0033E91F78
MTLFVGVMRLKRVQAVAQQVSDLPWGGSCLCAAGVEVPGSAGRMVRGAVPADGRAGGGAPIGAGLGICAEAARNRCGRVRGSRSGFTEGG